MNTNRVDRAARLLGSPVSRRSGVLVAIGCLFGVTEVRGADAARKATRRHEKLACRNAGSACTSNDECCSASCVVREGGTGFRCAKSHGGRSSRGGGRGGSSTSLIPNGFRCTPTDRCEDPRSSCTAYVNTDPEITYCLLPVGATCDADASCNVGLCDAGVCAAA